jgi:predicted transcriptional regulator of viral defense system
MEYLKFKNSIKEFPIFSTIHLVNFGENIQTLRNQLTFWQKKGLVVKLKKGLYVLNKDDRKINPSKPFIANQLLSPSYVSLQYALYFYGLIPETVKDLTSVTTRKTATFDNEFGRFVYHHIKLTCFCGFVEEKDENNLPFFIAEKEKALVDFFYLNLGDLSYDIEIFEDSYRIRKDTEIDKDRLIHFAGLFKVKKLMRITKNFCRYLEE